MASLRVHLAAGHWGGRRGPAVIIYPHPHPGTQLPHLLFIILVMVTFVVKLGLAESQHLDVWPNTGLRFSEGIF